MFSSLITSILLVGLVAAQAECPIKAYDARPGYGLMCVRGDSQRIYENELIQDLVVDGGQFDATVRFECVRKFQNANWLGYNYGGAGYCYVTEGNVEGEDNSECIRSLPNCDPSMYDTGRVGEYVPPTPPAGAGGLFGGLFAPAPVVVESD